MTPTAPRPLALDDIADAREYERQREAFRASIIELKKRRRVGVGPVATLLFENRETIRFQVQEMVRAEKILTDEGVQHELDTYNALIPAPGQLSATLFLELTDEWQLREWLPRLVGIERSLLLRLHDGTEVRCLVEESHEAQLTREETTASVHYVRFELTPSEVDAFAAGPVVLASDHFQYRHEALLGPEAHAELLSDLR